MEEGTDESLAIISSRLDTREAAMACLTLQMDRLAGVEEQLAADQVSTVMTVITMRTMRTCDGRILFVCSHCRCHARRW